MSGRSFLRRLAVLPTAICGLFTLVSLDAQAALFTETFPSTGDFAGVVQGQDLELRAQGWCGGNAGDAFCSNPPGTVANQGGEGAISVGNGPDGTAGFAFWSQTGINADSFLYTQKAPFNTAQVPAITWQQRDSGNDPTHLALKIGGNWFISDQTWNNNSSEWQLQAADLGALTFFVRSQPDPDVLPGGGTAPGGLPLPSDQIVSAFGFWWDGPKTGTSRIDDVTAVPLPAAAWMMLAGLGAIGVLRRRASQRATSGSLAA